MTWKQVPALLFKLPDGFTFVLTVYEAPQENKQCPMKTKKVRRNGMRDC